MDNRKPTLTQTTVPFRVSKGRGELSQLPAKGGEQHRKEKRGQMRSTFPPHPLSLEPTPV